MVSRRLPVKSLFLTTLLIAVLALNLMPMLATAAGSKANQSVYNKAVLHVTITLTKNGIVTKPASLSAGNHLITIKNNTSQSRGVEMIGIDSASSPTVRYTKILRPGKSEGFRWYFASGKTTFVRDILSCAHDQRSCMVVGFGKMSKAIDVN